MHLFGRNFEIIVRLLSPEPVGWIQHHQLYSSVGADIVMESVTLTDPWPILKTCNGVWVLKKCANRNVLGSYYVPAEFLFW
jgi:hypothetical protein